MERIEVLLEFLKIELDEARNYEAQRERILAVSFLLTGAVIAAVFADDNNITMGLWLAGGASVVNAYVSFVSIKFYSAFKMRYERYREFRNEIDRAEEGAGILEVIDRADKSHNAKLRFRRNDDIRMNDIWTSMPICMTFVTTSVFIALLLSD